MNQLEINQTSLQEKLSCYQENLQFIQSELIADRAKLQRAKMNHLLDLVKHIEHDISLLEQAVDRTQAQILSIKNQLATS